MAHLRIFTINITYTTFFFLLVLIILSALTSFVRVQTYYQRQIFQPNLSFNDIIIPILQLVPSQFYFYPWTLFTETFVETSVFKFVISIVVLFAGVNYLYKHWNIPNNTASPDNKILNETAKYIIILSILTNLSSIIIKTFLALIFKNSVSLQLPLNHGIYSILMSFIVVVKQLSPEHNLKLFKTFSIRLRQLPLIVLSFALLASILLQSLEPVIPTYNNFYISWAYLRYYQLNVTADLLPTSSSGVQQQTSLVRGDASDTFAFIQFFPDRIHNLLRPVSKFFYHSSVFLGLFRPFNDDDIESSNLRTIKRLNTTATSVTRDIADRRRQVALKVLEQRVGGSSGTPVSTSDPVAATLPEGDTASTIG